MHMKEITVTIDNAEFVVDIEKAKSLGVLKQVYKPITSFLIGDVYRIGNDNIIIVEHGYNTGWGDDPKRYNIMGLCGRFKNYSTFGKNGASSDEMLKYINDMCKTNHLVFVKNIGEDFKNLLNNLN